MRRRDLIIGTLSACAISTTNTQGAIAWTLITNDEILKEDKAARPKELPSRSQPAGAPAIEVSEPDTAKPVKSPVTIRIRFRPQTGTTINPATFRAKYGWLGIDITDRLVAHAQLDATGISANNAEIPAGRYMVVLQITDSLGRVGTRSLEFTVV